jgi:hypothetical protein
VPLTLSCLDISHNAVEALESFTDLRGSQISYLDASFNQLVKVDSSSFPAALETLLLNNNKISSIAPYTFFHLSKLVKADLSVNEISSFTENSIRLSAEAVNQEAKLTRYPHITNLQSIYCQLMDTQTKTFIPLVDARPDQFLCEYKTHCFSLCQCCQFDSCDCEMTCPDGCSCYHDTSTSFIMHLAAVHLSVGLLYVSTDLVWKLIVTWETGLLTC